MKLKKKKTLTIVAKVRDAAALSGQGIGHTNSVIGPASQGLGPLDAVKPRKAAALFLHRTLQDIQHLAP